MKTRGTHLCSHWCLCGSCGFQRSDKWGQHRQFLRNTVDSIDLSFQWKWFSTSNLKKVTEGFIFACQNQAIPTNLIKVRIFQQPGSIYCRLCVVCSKKLLIICLPAAV